MAAGATRRAGAPGWMTLVLAAALAVTSTGCIAFRAYGSLPEPASGRRSAAIKQRGLIALGVGIAELALAAGIGYALSTGIEPTASDEPEDDPTSALDGAAGDLLAYVVGIAFLATIGGTAGVSGLGDVACGTQDLLGFGGCDDIAAGFDEPPAPAAIATRPAMATIRTGMTRRDPPPGETRVIHELREPALPVIRWGEGIGPFQIGMHRADAGAQGLALAPLGPRTVCAAGETDGVCTYRLRFDGDVIDRVTLELSSSRIGARYRNQAVTAARGVKELAARMGCRLVDLRPDRATYWCARRLVVFWSADGCVRRLGDTEGTPCRAPPGPEGTISIIQERW